jgi:opacity protein-like surface antigen
MSKISNALLLLASAVFYPAVAQATTVNVDATEGGYASDTAADQATAPAAAADKVEVAFTPYLWVAGTKGSVALPRGDGEAEIDKSFADTLSNLKFAFMGTLDIKYKRFVVLGDVMYLSVGAKAKSIRDPNFFEGHVDSSTFVSTIEGGYRVVDQGPLFFDLVGGARISSLHAKVKLEGPLTTRERSATVSQVTPILGARLQLPVAKNTSLGVYGDVGVSNSDVKWQVFGSVHQKLSTHWSLLAGYRYMKINHSTQRFDFDMSLSGPLIGATYRF